MRATVTDTADNAVAYADYSAATEVLVINRGPSDCYVENDADATLADGVLVKVDEFFSRTLRSKRSRVSAICDSGETTELHILAEHA